MTALRPFIGIVVCFALVSGAPSQDVAGASQDKFAVHRGVNVSGPFLTVYYINPNGTGHVMEYRGIVPYLQNVKKIPGWYTGDDLHSHGFDFVRLLVNPLPLLEDSPLAREGLYDDIAKGIDAYRIAGLRVIVSNMFRDAAAVGKVTADAESQAFADFRVLINDTARRLSTFPSGSVALELLNEPPGGNCATNGWLLEQQVLVKDIRKISSVLPIVITGCNYGQADGVTFLNSSNINLDDPNIFVSIHYYQPMAFTHQGSKYQEFKYIQGLVYPADISNLAEVLHTTNRNIDESRLSIADSLKAKEVTMKYITRYFADMPNAGSINHDFDKVSKWAQDNHFPSSRIILGEFAALNWRTNDTSVYHRSRLRWDLDVRRAAEAHGVAWSYLNLTYPFGDVFEWR